MTKFSQLIDVGFFVCLDSFLSMLTVMPTRIVMTLWRLLCTRLVISFELLFSCNKAFDMDVNCIFGYWLMICELQVIFRSSGKKIE
jgi:hypothetical protein